MSEWITVARAEELAQDERRVIEVDSTQVVVFNLDGQYYAIALNQQPCTVNL